MNIPDLIMGLFEATSGAATALNVRRLWVDKKVSGVSLWPTAFFLAWGFYNCYYYPHLDQWWAFMGGLFMLMVNLSWLVLAIKYRKN